MHDCRTICWNVCNLSKKTSLKKTDTHTASSHQLPISPQLGVGHLGVLPLSMLGFWLTLSHTGLVHGKANSCIATFFSSSANIVSWKTSTLPPPYLRNVEIWHLLLRYLEDYSIKANLFWGFLLFWMVISKKFPFNRHKSIYDLFHFYLLSFSIWILGKYTCYHFNIIY